MVPPPIQVPSTAKQPSARSIPFAKVEVPVPDTESEVAEIEVFEMEPPVMVGSVRSSLSRCSMRATAPRVWYTCVTCVEFADVSE